MSRCLPIAYGSFVFFFQAEDGIRDKLVTGVQTCFFFQAEDGIRDKLVTGVQTCALPISSCAVGADGAARRDGAGREREPVDRAGRDLDEQQWQCSERERDRKSVV